MATLWWAGALHWETAGFTWWNWWVGDTIGVFVFAPILLAFFARPKELWRGRRISVGLPLLFTLLLYIVIFVQAGTWEHVSNTLAFERTATQTADRMNVRFSGYLDSLYALQGVMSVDGNDNQKTFEAAAEHWLEVYKGVYDFSYVPRVKFSERRAHEAAGKRDGHSDYQIGEPGIEGKLLPSPDRLEYFPSFLVAPQRRDENMLGFNQAVDPERYHTMERARDTAKPAATQPIHLVQRVSFRSAIVIYLPVYRGPHETVDERRANLKGFVKAVFSVEDVLRAALDETEEQEFRIRLFDDEPSHGKELYPTFGESEKSDPPNPVTTPIRLADRTLWLQISPRDTYFRRQRGPGPWIMLASGMLMSGLLAAFLLAITGYSFRIEKELFERAQIATQLRKSGEELSQSNSELQQFAYAASHDLQEPLRSIAMHLQIVEKQMEGSLDSTAMESISFAVDGAKRMSALIRDLLAYSQLGKRESKTATVPAILELTLKNLEVAIAESGARIERGALPDIRFDRTQGILLFQNLIGNALKYRDPARAVRVEIRARKEDAAWLFTVSDNGIGVPADSAESIFLVFRRLHANHEYPGTGIGLAICRKIVEKHGGRIWVVSTPGAGSEFNFTLPDSPLTA